ncbi:MAG: desulfoferrodoxin family protein [Sphaerochaetaceae bacterium]|nr:desulfoferrodoxin family protein [Sphaerochaetaceae bacterium]
MKLFVCRHCGNIITFVHDSGVPVVCCGEKMQELVPNTVDAAFEKHLPVIKREGSLVTVSVGEVAHPMTEKHYIQWIVLVTRQGVQRKDLSWDLAPAADFLIAENDEVVEAYAYCNLHGLWKK